jgi:hypothetical protein
MVVGNENQGGSGRWHTFGIGLGPWRPMFFYLLIVVFNFNVFPFPPSKPQFLGDVPMNRLDAANCSPRYEYFMFFCVMEGDRGSEEMEMGREM